MSRWNITRDWLYSLSREPHIDYEKILLMLPFRLCQIKDHHLLHLLCHMESHLREIWSSIYPDIPYLFIYSEMNRLRTFIIICYRSLSRVWVSFLFRLWKRTSSKGLSESSIGKLVPVIFKLKLQCTWRLKVTSWCQNGDLSYLKVSVRL